jgi:hypothetical protein
MGCKKWRFQPNASLSASCMQGSIPHIDDVYFVILAFYLSCMQALNDRLTEG